MINLILFGPPGAGKGTQSQKLIEKYQLSHISTGDLFRYNMKNATSLGKLAKSYIDAGNLVPDEVTNNMVKDFIERTPSKNGYILDGYPRSSNQAKYIDNLLDDFKLSPALLLSLEVNEDELIKRLLERGKTSNRIDDQDESVIRKRQNVYQKETAPVKEYYDCKKRAYSISGLGDVETIFDRIAGVIQKHL